MNITLIHGSFLLGNRKLNLCMDFRELREVKVSDLIKRGKCTVGLDIGDKTIGIAVSDKRCKVATSLGLINRSCVSPRKDYENLRGMIVPYNPGLLVFGWPLQMNGEPGQQCKKNLEFLKGFWAFLAEQRTELLRHLLFSKWDERFSTKVVENIMIEADLSRKRRKEVIDKTAAVYILQGAIDFMNRNLATTIWKEQTNEQC